MSANLNTQLLVQEAQLNVSLDADQTATLNVGLESQNVGELNTVLGFQESAKLNVGLDSERTAQLQVQMGLKGANGEPVELRENAGWIQWKYESDSTWTNLFEIPDPGGLVNSVNGEIGDVVLTAEDVDADPIGSASTAETNANGYTDAQIAALDFLTLAEATPLFRSNYTEVVIADKTIVKPGAYLIFNSSPTPLELVFPNAQDFPGTEIFILNTPFGFTNITAEIDGGSQSYLPPGTFCGYRSFQLPPEFGGDWLWGSAQRAGTPYDLPPWYDPSTGNALVDPGWIVKIVTDIATGLDIPKWVAPDEPLPDQTGNADKILGTDGTNASWVDPPATNSGFTLADGPEYESSFAYVGYTNGLGEWYIYRRNRTNNLREYAFGSSDYSDNWDDRASLTYS